MKDLREFIATTIREYLNEHVIIEGYSEIDELNKLTTDVILSFAEKNYPMINRINKKGFDTMEGHYFNYDTLDFEDIVKNKSDYKILGEYINSNNTIMFINDIGSDGLYFQHNKLIKIKYSDNFKDSLKYNLNLAKIDEYGSISKNECYRILRVSMGVAFRSVILHELQHSYDDYKSKGKFKKNKANVKYYSKYKSNNPNNTSGKMSDEQFKKYLKLPHEYWARFSEVVIDIYNFNKPFNNIVSEFKRKMLGFESLSDSDKRRLLRSLYKYWDIKNQ